MSNLSLTQKNLTIPIIGEGKLGVQGHIGYLLRQAYTAHRLRMENTLSKIGITVPQFTTLTMLEAYPTASNANLAKLTLLTPQTMTVIIKNLEKEGWITRENHATHGRVKVINLTSAGKEKLTQAKKLAHQTEGLLLENTSTDEEKIIREWLVSVAKPANQK